MKHWGFLRLLISKKGHKVLQFWQLNIYSILSDINASQKCIATGKHTSSFSIYFCSFPKGLNLVWANSKASVLPMKWDFVKAGSLQHVILRTKLISAHHFLEQTSSTKWRLRRSNCKSLLFSRISCASCSVSSIALSAFPSSAKWKIPEEKWNLPSRRCLLPIVGSNKLHRYQGYFPAYFALILGTRRGNIKTSREACLISFLQIE